MRPKRDEASDDVSSVSEEGMDLEDARSDLSWEFVYGKETNGAVLGEIQFDRSSSLCGRGEGSAEDRSHEENVMHGGSDVRSTVDQGEGGNHESCIDMDGKGGMIGDATNGEDGHSDAETYTTDDLFRHAEPLGVVEGRDEWGDSSRPYDRSFEETSEAEVSLIETKDEKPAIQGKTVDSSSVDKRHRSGDSLNVSPGPGKRFELLVVRIAAVARNVVVSSECLFAKVFDGFRTVAAQVALLAAQIRYSADRSLEWMYDVSGVLTQSLRLGAAIGTIMARETLSFAHARALVVVQEVGKIASDRMKPKFKYGCTFVKKMDWTKISLILGCGTLAGALYRSGKANARLTTRLAQREGELAELIARIVALQRAISSPRSHAPLLRHMHSSCAMVNGWPMPYISFVECL